MSAPAASAGPLIMGRYRMGTGDEDHMGEGTSSVCWRGVDTRTGAPVAVKIYKAQTPGGAAQVSQEVTLVKFRRQVEVLEALREPLVPHADPALWHPQLESCDSKDLFMQLLDHSRDAAGQPGPDAEDGVLYVVTELAEYSVDDLLNQQRETKQPLSKDILQTLSRSVILVIAGLHAKGFVHLDIKPENLMVFNGVLKLIDVDGCVRVGDSLSITDSSISFSPVFCSPEWANFLIDDSDGQTIVAAPALDAWSVGMTLWSLVALNAAFKPVYQNFAQQARSSSEGGFLFMEWLSSLTEPPVPKSIQRLHPEIAALLTNSLLVCDREQRKTCAQCLSMPYLADPAKPSVVPKARRLRKEDRSSAPPQLTGTLWKLNRGGDPKDEAQWLQRDMWIAADGSLCYFSMAEHKRLVGVGAGPRGLKISRVSGSAKEHAFEVTSTAVTRVGAARAVAGDKPVVAPATVIVACTSAQQFTQWTRFLLSLQQTQRLGLRFKQDMSMLKLAVHNRRRRIGDDAREEFEPVFKGQLWKLNSGGDPTRTEDWLEREMWLSRNGSLVYWSIKDEHDLVYYTASDIANAVVQPIQDGAVALPFAFQIRQVAEQGVEFTPADFAAESAELRDRWLAELSKFTIQ